MPIVHRCCKYVLSYCRLPPTTITSQVKPIFRELREVYLETLVRHLDAKLNVCLE